MTTQNSHLTAPQNDRCSNAPTSGPASVPTNAPASASLQARFYLEDVCFVRGSRTILDRLHLCIEAGQRIALLGPSGAGKSTLLHLMLGFLAPSAGCIYMNGQLVSQAGQSIVPPQRRELAVVFQNLALWPHMTVQENLAFGLRANKLPRDEIEERIDAILRRVGLHGYHKHYPGALSGGEQQRVAIARSLVMRPCAILLDEPLSHLDIVLRAELLALFQELFVEQRSTVFYISHDPWEARQITSTVAILEDHKIIYQGAWQHLPTQSHSPFLGRVQSQQRT